MAASRLPALRAGRTLLVLAVLAGMGWAAPARADMWGYIDAQGVAHFSAAQLDHRYELFFRSGESFDTSEDPVRGTPVPEITAGSPPRRLLTYFDVSPNYKAVRYLLREASQAHGIDYALLQAVIATESGFNRFAVSPKGAVGLMQLMPPTAARYGVKAQPSASIEKQLTDPRINIPAGARYLGDLIRRFPGRIELALAAYNAGEGAVQRAGNAVPNYPETKNYVKTVMQLYSHLQPAAAPPTAPPGRIRFEMTGGAGGRSNMPGSDPVASVDVDEPGRY
jgi:Transglycosylase SLT domain